MSHQPNNVFAGTQVVSLVEVRGTNNSLVHPRGAVGVVTRTPASEAEKLYLVRFPDGFEGSLTRDQLDVLKHFKDRLPASDATPGLELEQLIIYRCVVGSRAYGPNFTVTPKAQPIAIGREEQLLDEDFNSPAL